MTTESKPGQRPAKTQSSESGGFVRHARFVSLLTLGSRLLGLTRDAVLAWIFGMTSVMDAFVIAFMIPNLFRRLFGEGSLAGAFIPQYSQLDNQNPVAARQFLLKVIKGLAFGLFGVYLLALILIAVSLYLLSPPEKWVLPLRLTMITLAYMPLVCMVAILGAALQCHQKFGPAAAAPILLNIVIITAAMGTAFAPGGMSDETRLMIVCGSIVFAGFIQLLWCWLAARAIKPATKDTGKTLTHDGVEEAWKALLKQWGPTTLGLAVLQINTLADVLIVMFFSAAPGAKMSWLSTDLNYPMTTGSVAVLNGAQRLFQFPLGVFGIAVATAIFPALARMAHRRVPFTRLMRQGIRLTCYIGLPAAIGMALISDALADSIFHAGGQLTTEDSQNIAHVLKAYAPAVLGYSLIQILTRAFYAREDPMTPLKVSVCMVVLNLTLNLCLIWPFGVAGVGWSTCICAFVQCAVLFWLTRRHLRLVIPMRFMVGLLKTVMVSIMMGVVVFPMMWFLPDWLSFVTWGRGQAMITAASIAICGALVVLIGSKLLGMPELRWTLGRRVDGQ